jgi:hypothetical protein
LTPYDLAKLKKSTECEKYLKGMGGCTATEANDPKKIKKTTKPKKEQTSDKKTPVSSSNKKPASKNTETDANSTEKQLINRSAQTIISSTSSKQKLILVESSNESSNDVDDSNDNAKKDQPTTAKVASSNSKKEQSKTTNSTTNSTTKKDQPLASNTNASVPTANNAKKDQPPPSINAVQQEPVEKPTKPSIKSEKNKAVLENERKIEENPVVSESESATLKPDTVLVLRENSMLMKNLNEEEDVEPIYNTDLNTNNNSIDNQDDYKPEEPMETEKEKLENDESNSGNYLKYCNCNEFNYTILSLFFTGFIKCSIFVDVSAKPQPLSRLYF